jgi:hypothetical protein
MAGETPIPDLIKDLKQGALILPQFQRVYVWSRDQVRSFLNCLYRGYPTGSFLIRKTPTPPKVRGDVPSDDSKSYRLILERGIAGPRLRAAREEQVRRPRRLGRCWKPVWHHEAGSNRRLVVFTLRRIQPTT